MRNFRWGIFGTGAISSKFAAGLRSADDAEIVFVASRDQARADTFAAAHSIPRAIGGYAEAAASGGVDAIYIATPASHHSEHALICVASGVPVLVEKPFAATGEEARRIQTAAARQGVFAMEAMWTRFLPAAQAMRERVREGSAGVPAIVAGSFGLSQIPEPSASMFDSARGGGALSHLAPYPLSLAQWLFGSPIAVQAFGNMGSTGVDETVSMQLRYANGVLGSFHVSLRSWATDDFQVLGSHGSTRFRGSIVRPYGLDVSQEAPRVSEPANFGLKARLRQNALVHAVAQRTSRSSRATGSYHPHHYSGNGYHYEANEVRRGVTAGRLESKVMPLDDTIEVLNTIDRVRTLVAPRIAGDTP